MASVFWKVTAPGTIFVVLSKGPLVTVAVPYKSSNKTSELVVGCR